MIPKKIHYVWVGGKKMPNDIKRCLKTWHKYLKDYEIIEWNEHNFDINKHPFIRKAYEAQKWAFVSDYIRAYVIYHEGGIYLDTDNCVLRNLDDLRNNRAFVGFENEDYPFTACFGAEAHHPFVKDMLDYYDNMQFTYDKNNELQFVNTKSVSDILIQKYHCEIGNKEQILKEDIKVYPDDVLCNPSSHSYVIHVFTGTWMEEKKSLKRRIVKFLKVRINSVFKAKLYAKFIGK